jgi:hypothetical protein
VGGNDEIFQMRVLYDWGATASMITHQAVEQAGLKPTPLEEKEVSGLNGAKSSSGCTYMVLLVDHSGKARRI